MKNTYILLFASGIFLILLANQREKFSKISAPSTMDSEIMLCPNDSLILVNFYNETNGTSWTISTNWLVPGQPISTWYGITANGSGCVTAIQFPMDNNLTGNFPTPFLLVPGMDSLEILRIRQGDFLADFNDVLSELATLPQLETLVLAYNAGMTGLLPPSMPMNWFPMLDTIIIKGFGADLTGTLPPGLFCLDSIDVIRFPENNLSGSIPDIGCSPDISKLDFEFNNLSGVVPDWVGDLPNLHLIYLNDNTPGFTGGFPSGFNSMTTLEWFNIQNNCFDSLPPNITTNNLSIVEFKLAYNKLTFNDLEPNHPPDNTFADTSYCPQDSIPMPGPYSFNEGSNAIIDLGEDENMSNNTYEWFKKDGMSWVSHCINTGGNSNACANDNALVFNSIDITDEEYYYCEITNSTMPGCTLYSQVFFVDVVENPCIAEAGDNITVCEGIPINFSETGGDAFSWSWNGPGVGNMDDPNLQNPIIANAVLADSGTYTVTITTMIGGCTATDMVEVVVNGLPNVNLNLPDTDDCIDNNTLPLSGGTPPGGSYSGNGVTGTNFDASAAGLGTHTITYSFTDGNGCSNSATNDITVFDLPIVNLNLPDTDDCIDNNTLPLSGGTPPGGSYSGNGVTGTNFDASAAGLGTHTITYSFTDGNGCSNSATNDITVFDLPIVNLNLPDTDDCIDNNTLPLSGGTPPGGSYSGNGVTGTNFDASAAGLGTHTITYSFTDGNGCSNSATNDITVFDLPIVNLNLPDTDDCIDNNTLPLSGGTPPGGSYSGNGVTGTNFDASAAGLGTHTITYSFTDGNGCSNSATNDITVFDLPIVNLNLPDTDDCIDNNTLPLSGGTPPGGSYSGNGVTGTNFDASAAGLGTHTITYSFTDGNGCSNSAVQQVEVFALPNLVFPDIPDLCVDDGSVTLVASPSGGVFSGPGVSGNQFDPGSAGAGFHDITYFFTDGNGCSNSAVQQVEVFALPNLVFPDIPDLCVDDGSVTLVASPSGGVFSGPGVSGNQFDPGSAGAGFHDITYFFTDGNGCSNSAVQQVEVFALPNLVFPDIPDLCVDDGSVTLVASPSGGVFSGPGVSGNQFDPGSAGAGFHDITYFFTDGNGCSNSAVQQVEVFALPNLVFPDIPDLCVDDGSVTLVASPSGGVFSGPGVSGNQFDPGSAGAGFHDITYFFTDGNGCSNSAVQQVEVFALPNLVFPDIPDLCVDDGSVTLVASPSGGVFSGPGVSGNQFDPGSAGAGFHDITYFFTDGNGCSNSAVQQVEVFALPNLVFPDIPDLCVDDGSVTLVASPSGGVFSGPGVSGNQFDPGSAGAGMHILTYAFTDSNNCTNSTSVDVTINLSLTTDIVTTICEGENYPVGDSTYTQSGTYVNTLIGANNCDSTVTLSLTVSDFYETNLVESICEGESIMIGDSVYTATGNFSNSFTAINNCDSIVNLALTVNVPSVTDIVTTICEGENYPVGDSTYTQSGTYVNTLIGANNCDSTVTLSLTVSDFYETNLVESICEGESIMVGDSVYTATGNFSNSFTAINNCDSIVNLALTVNVPSVTDIVTTICEGENYPVGDSTYTQSGTYVNTLIGANNCDSTVTLSLTVSDFYETNLVESICEGESIMVGDSVYTATGNFSNSFTAINNCDSIVNLALTVNVPSVTDIVTTICEGENYPVGDSTYTQSGTYVNTLIGANNCDSTVTLSLTVSDFYETNLVESICEGESIMIGDSVYTATGNFSNSFTAINNCDSIVNLALTVNVPSVTDIVTTICEGENYPVGDSTYTQSGTYVNTLIGANNCDSTVTLSLTVSDFYETNLVESICEGESIMVGDSVYTATGNFSNSFTAINNCDSIVNLALTVNVPSVTDIVTTICEGENYPVGDSTYTQSGTYVNTLIGANNCDSTVTLSLTVSDFYETNLVESICEGESIMVGDSVYTATGNFSNSFTAINNCDSIVNLALTVNVPSVTDIVTTICEGENYPVGDSTYTQSGTYVNTLIGANNCDSTVTLSLTVSDFYETNLVESICEGESIMVGDSVYTATGNFSNSFTAINNCDSIVNLALTVNVPSVTDIVTTICEGENYPVGDSTYTQSGTYVNTLIGVNNCDSTVTLSLTVSDFYETNLVESICEGESIMVGDSVYTATGNFSNSFTAINNCDSIVNLALTVNVPSVTDIVTTICEGESYPVGDSTYTQSGTYVNTLIGANNCDSTVTLSLTVSDFYETNLVESICEGESIMVGDSVYTATGNFSNSFTAINNCDSIVNLALTVNVPSVTDIVTTICEGESYPVGDSTYTQSGTYVNTLIGANNCDSTVTLSLTVSDFYETNLVESICEGESIMVGDSVYTATGNFSNSFTAINNCDSIVNLALTVNVPSVTDIVTTICEGESYPVGDSTYTQSGTYVNTLIGANNCDSIVNLALTVHPLPDVNIDPAGPFCSDDPIQTLTAIPIGGTWGGAANSSGQVDPAALGNGNHLVTYEFTDNNGCTNNIDTNITIIQEDDVAFSYPTQACTDASINPVPSVPPGVTGTFSVDNGASINPATGELDLTTTLAGVTYTITFSSTGPCPNTFSQDIVIDSDVTHDADQSLCEGDTIYINSTAYFETGIYMETISNGASNGCDSLITLNLTVYESQWTQIDTTVCEGESIQIDTMTFDESGNYSVLLNTWQGCDSTIQLNLEVYPIPNYTVLEQDCDTTQSSYWVTIATEAAELIASEGTVINNNNNTFTVFNIPLGTDLSFSVVSALSANCGNDGFINSLEDCPCNISPPEPVYQSIEICNGEEYPAFEVMVDPGLSVNWYKDDGTLLLENSIIFTPSGGGNYYAEAYEELSDCTSDWTLLFLGIMSSPSIGKIDTALCSGSSITINGENYMESTIIPLAGWAENGCDSIIWLTIRDTTCITINNKFGITPEASKNKEFIIPDFVKDLYPDVDNFKLSIFNRWKTQVYVKEDYKRGFIGDDKNGNKLLSGTYFLLLEPQNSVRAPFTGTITIIR